MEQTLKIGKGFLMQDSQPLGEQRATERSFIHGGASKAGDDDISNGEAIPETEK